MSDPDAKVSSSHSVHTTEKEKTGHDVDERNEVPLYNAHMDISEVNERKLMRKLDLRLIPWLALLYLLSFLDRTSIGNAKVCDD